ncbi:MAG: lipoprotein-releasing ABC transporter permease subunit [Coxiellaceae bacterium]|jgi:lipoprotein-releasing system permease protein|nr:lipoprotein-releasing ABC transporter permease subunit [Coxiellaceae bacterium]
MFKPVEFYIGLRYIRAKKKNHFVSFVSLTSMLGIALGITVLITVLSVMNGFDYEIRNRILSVARQVTITGVNGNLNIYHEIRQELNKKKEIIASAPFVSGQGMLVKDGRASGVMLEGILPSKESCISNIHNTLIQGSMFKLKSGLFGIVIGRELAAILGAEVGDKVILIIPHAAMTATGLEPRLKRFVVVGIFNVGEGFGYDSTVAFINLHDAQKIFGLKNMITGINLKLRDLYTAPLISQELTESLGEECIVVNWTYQYGSLFKAIRMEKTMMFVVLSFIIAVAAFNLVSSLVMTVSDKQSDIAILRTLGATPKMIMGIFIVQGGVIGVFGTLLGVGSGILLALNAPYLVTMLERVFNAHFIPAWIYYIDYLPSKLDIANVWLVGIITLSMSLLATIYPAWRAAKIEPACALRYE